MGKINFQVDKDIANHPHFHYDFLRLVLTYERMKEINCPICSHSLLEHCLARGNEAYCRTCNKKKGKCKDVIKNKQLHELKIALDKKIKTEPMEAQSR